MSVHTNGNEAAEVDEEQRRKEQFLQRYIQYAKQRCFPRLSEQASRLLISEYVQLRQEVGVGWGACFVGCIYTHVVKRTFVYSLSQVKKAMSGESTDLPPIPITVRQLEAIIRIAESLARMSLQTIATGMCGG